MKKNKTRTRKPIIAMALTLTLLMACVVTAEFCKLPKAVPESVVSDDKGSIGDTQFFNDTKGAKASTKVKKPGQVKTLKKVNVRTYYDKKSKRNVSTAKIKFSKVKGATGYQVLIYNTIKTNDLTPLVFAFNTKKTTYTIKNLVPQMKYTIKVRAYTKGKDGKIVYGKTKSLKIKTGGQRKGMIFICNTCGACVANANLLGKHTKDVYNIHHELHGGYTFYMQ